jgi:hypothetical protein
METSSRGGEPLAAVAQAGKECTDGPPTPIRQLGRLFYALTGGLGLPPLAPSVEQKLLEAALGRPGWIVKCTEIGGCLSG